MKDENIICCDFCRAALQLDELDSSVCVDCLAELGVENENI